MRVPEKRFRVSGCLAIRGECAPIPRVKARLWAKLSINFLRLPADLVIRPALGDREGAITTAFFQESHLSAAEWASLRPSQGIPESEAFIVVIVKAAERSRTHHSRKASPVESFLPGRAHFDVPP